MPRLTRENGDFVDTPWPEYTEWEWGERDENPPDECVIMRGEVMHVGKDGRAVLSMGGLLCRMRPPHAVVIGDACSVTLTKEGDQSGVGARRRKGR